jgi:outer membrane protein OmpA-like peptidoglycan-associated protein
VRILAAGRHRDNSDIKNDKGRQSGREGGELVHFSGHGEAVKTENSEGGVKMQAITAKRVFILVIAVFSMSLLVGCSGKERRPEYRGGYLYYPTALVSADRALDEARAAGKDKECPAEFNAAKGMVDKSYEIYMACRDQEAIDMAQAAIGKIKALCPPKPVEKKPEPTPPPPPPPAPKPEPTPPPPPPPPAPIVKPVIILEDIHFDFDEAVLTKTALDILDSNVKVLKDNQGINVQIEGHTCAHGAEDHNMALGERRANAVKEYFVNRGIAAERMTTISYGETRLAMPEVPTPKNKESKEAKMNRRVHFEVIVK